MILTPGNGDLGKYQEYLCYIHYVGPEVLACRNPSEAQVSIRPPRRFWESGSASTSRSTVAALSYYQYYDGYIVRIKL